MVHKNKGCQENEKYYNNGTGGLPQYQILPLLFALSGGSLVRGVLVLTAHGGLIKRFSVGSTKVR